MKRNDSKFITSFKMQLKRRYLLLLKKEVIEKGLTKRRGECKGCGECCKASFRCPFLFEKEGKLLCQIHQTKPLVCQSYPFNEQDVFPHTKGKCGYHFVSEDSEETEDKKE